MPLDALARRQPLALASVLLAQAESCRQWHHAARTVRNRPHLRGFLLHTGHLQLALHPLSPIRWCFQLPQRHSLPN